MKQSAGARFRPIFALLIAGTLAGCAASPSFFRAAGPVAAEQRELFWIVNLLLLAVVLPVFIGLPYVLWRYRRGNIDSTYQPKWTFNTKLEFFIWGVPIAVVLALSVILWHATHQLDPYKRIDGQGQVTVQVVGLDWKWLFIYPDQHIATVNKLVVPAGRPVHLELTSDTVMQSFFIPQFGSQIYAMAGMRTQLNLKADRPGVYLGENTQYNGNGFHRQNFRTYAVSDAQFDAWVKQVQSGSQPLDAARYAALSKQSVPDHPIAFSSVPNQMFAHIIGKYLYPKHQQEAGQ